MMGRTSAGKFHIFQPDVIGSVMEKWLRLPMEKRSDGTTGERGGNGYRGRQ